MTYTGTVTCPYCAIRIPVALKLRQHEAGDTEAAAAEPVQCHDPRCRERFIVAVRAEVAFEATVLPLPGVAERVAGRLEERERTASQTTIAAIQGAAIAPPAAARPAPPAGAMRLLISDGKARGPALTVSDK